MRAPREGFRLVANSRHSTQSAHLTHVFVLGKTGPEDILGTLSEVQRAWPDVARWFYSACEQDYLCHASAPVPSQNVADQVTGFLGPEAEPPLQQNEWDEATGENGNWSEVGTPGLRRTPSRPIVQFSELDEGQGGHASLTTS